MLCFNEVVLEEYRHGFGIDGFRLYAQVCASQWRALISEFEASGVSQRAFCIRFMQRGQVVAQGLNDRAFHRSQAATVIPGACFRRAGCTTISTC